MVENADVMILQRNGNTKGFLEVREQSAEEAEHEIQL